MASAPWFVRARSCAVRSTAAPRRTPRATLHVPRRRPAPRGVVPCMLQASSASGASSYASTKCDATTSATSSSSAPLREMLGGGEVAWPCARASRASRTRRDGRGPAGTRTGRARASVDQTGETSPPCARARKAADRAPPRHARRARQAQHVVNVLPSTDRVLEQTPLVRGEAVKARRDQRVQRLGHLERVDRRRPADTPEPSSTSAPRSSSIRTVSTAYRGTPSARARICPRSGAGRPGTSPVSNSSIACSDRGSR